MLFLVLIPRIISGSQSNYSWGLTALWISKEEVLHLVKPFDLALIGKFPLCRPVLDSICKFFFNLKLTSAFSVTLLDQCDVLIKLSNDFDYGRVFAHRSYYVSNYFMKLIKWSPFFYIRGNMLSWILLRRKGSLPSSIITPSEAVCVNNATDSPMVSPSDDNPLKILDFVGNQMDNINLSSDAFVVKNLLNDGCDGAGNFVADNSKPIIDSDFPFERMDVSNSTPTIDLLFSYMPNDGCINLAGGLQSVDPVDHSDWIEEFLGNKYCKEDLYGGYSNLSLDDFDLNVMNIDKAGFLLFGSYLDPFFLVAKALPAGVLERLNRSGLDLTQLESSQLEHSQFNKWVENANPKMIHWQRE
ncbi:hypothetical protein IEQ34_020956 [Dendrobium chrysotoxum]|uniref:Uncharacterized protein n=1 Tax=Dendrobium chrysotoxum TaxID=161865 RepID=A0AAV7G2S5_DENCH|nr:hypothetical protein IEQ34_020956 [Dendrobium chrysotoxum]